MIGRALEIRDDLVLGPGAPRQAEARLEPGPVGELGAPAQVLGKDVGRDVVAQLRQVDRVHLGTERGEVVSERKFVMKVF